MRLRKQARTHTRLCKQARSRMRLRKQARTHTRLCKQARSRMRLRKQARTHTWLRTHPRRHLQRHQQALTNMWRAHRPAKALATARLRAETCKSACNGTIACTARGPQAPCSHCAYACVPLCICMRAAVHMHACMHAAEAPCSHCAYAEAPCSHCAYACVHACACKSIASVHSLAIKSTRTHTKAHWHARAHAHTHTHTHTQARVHTHTRTLHTAGEPSDATRQQTETHVGAAPHSLANRGSACCSDRWCQEGAPQADAT